jgi:2,3-bisphosphoglycerate-independent phosphoglycerate mutase
MQIGGVHAHIDHLFNFLKGAKEFGVPQTFVQFFADGRDTAPKSADGYLVKLMDYLKGIKYGELASITGRYYAMDRDKRWERTCLAYEGISFIFNCSGIS